MAGKRVHTSNLFYFEKIWFTTRKALRKYKHTFALWSQGDMNWLQGTSQTRLQYSLIDPFRFMELEKEEVVRKIYHNLQKIHALCGKIAEGVGGRKEEIACLYPSRRSPSPSSS